MLFSIRLFSRKILSVPSIANSWIGWLSHDRIADKLKGVYSFLRAKHLAVCYDSNAHTVVHDDGNIRFYYSDDTQEQNLSAYSGNKVNMGKRV